MGSKAITPIISIILLLMMTVVASTAAYLWMSSIQSNIQQSVQSNLEDSFQGQLTSFTIISSSCESTPDNVTAVLMNTKSVNINSKDLVLTLTASNGATIDIIIDPNFAGLDASESVSMELESAYDIQSGTRYSMKVTIPGGTSMTDTCTAQ